MSQLRVVVLADVDDLKDLPWVVLRLKHQTSRNTFGQWSQHDGTWRRDGTWRHDGTWYKWWHLLKDFLQFSRLVKPVCDVMVSSLNAYCFQKLVSSTTYLNPNRQWLHCCVVPLSHTVDSAHNQQSSVLQKRWLKYIWIMRNCCKINKKLSHKFKEKSFKKWTISHEIKETVTQINEK